MPNTQDITIQGTVFTIAAPYAEGYTVKPNEAAALNGLLGENVRNNQATRVRDYKLKAAGWTDEQIKKASVKDMAAAVEKVTLNDEQKAELQAQIDEYVTSYEFGVRTGGGRSKDPLEREIDVIVTDMLERALKDKGYSPSKFRKDSKDKYDALYARVLDTNRDSITKRAKKRLDDLQKNAESLVDLDFGPGAGEPDPAQGGEAQEAQTEAA